MYEIVDIYGLWKGMTRKETATDQEVTAMHAYSMDLRSR
jgi:hypothetical protein